MPDSATPTPSRELRGGAVFTDPLARELLAARSVGVLATIEPDGAVHAVPMWFAPLTDAIVLATGSSSRKVRNLERDDRATLVVHDSRPGCEVCGLSMRGRVEIVPADEADPLVELVHARYITPEGANLAAAAAFLASDDVALRFVPERTITWDERNSAAAESLRSHGGALPLESTAPRP